MKQHIKILFEQVKNMYPTKVVVDSSKSYSHLRAMFESGVVASEEVKIIFNKRTSGLGAFISKIQKMENRYDSLLLLRFPRLDPENTVL